MKWLVEFARQVRESTVKRLAQVRPEDRNWRPAEGVMSFADTLKHLIEVDRWLLDRVDGQAPADVEPSAGTADNMDWDVAMAEFQQLGRQIQERLSRYTTEDLPAGLPAAAPDDVDLTGGKASGNAPENTPLWQLIFRRGLDHEIHHRGELQLMLMLRYGA